MLRLAAPPDWPPSLSAPGPNPQDAHQTRTRPVFAYPERSVYSGSGSINDAANVTGVMPSPLADDDVDWVGKNLCNRQPTENH
jgi:hypothetical protein